LNGDGIPDLLIGASNGLVNAYQNTGTATSPIWTAAPASWGIATACNVATSGATNPQTYSAPRLADLNGDGLLDLIVGNRDGMCIYQNSGSQTVPSWTRNTTWETSFSGLAVGRFYAPAVADLDNDGKIDVMLGSSTTTIAAYRNTGTASSPAWTATAGWNITGLAAAQRYSPAIADLDGDGDYDLMVGNSDGLIQGYQNTGTTAAPTWSANSAWNITDLFSDPTHSSLNFAAPGLGDLNGDGSIDLFYGDAGGVAYAYKNTGLFATSGQYTSKVVNAGTHGGFTTLSYTAVIPSGTTLTVDVRAGNTAVPDGTWTPWYTGIANGGDISVLGTRQYVQYRVNPATSNTSVSPALFNIQANTSPSAPTAIVVSVTEGQGSGGGELGILELLAMSVFALAAGGGIRRRAIFPKV
jgi:hypothetical protein